MPIPDLSNLNLLVVDDSPHMQRLLVAMLNALNIRKIQCACDGNEALTAVRNLLPDIIITDAEMQPMGGIELVRTLRADTSVNVNETPIIMVTGHTERKWVENARDAGIDHFLAKPISAESLYRRLGKVILNPRHQQQPPPRQEPIQNAAPEDETVFL